MRFKSSHSRILLAFATAAIGLTCPAQAEPVQAMSAAAFLGAFGANSHLSAAPVNHGGTYYGIFNPVAAGVSDAGAVANLHALLDGLSFNPSRLDFQVADMPALGHQLLMQKSNGTFVLALWNEAQPVSGIPDLKTSATNMVTLKLPAAASLVQVFDPSVGIRTQQTAVNATTIPITVPNHPILVFIVPQIQSL